MDSLNRIHEAPVGHVERAAVHRKAKVKTEEPGAARPHDSVEKSNFTREDRIRIAFARSAKGGAAVMKKATGTYSGFIIGAAIGFGLIGGIYGPVIGGLAGSIGAMVLEEVSSKKKAEVADSLKHIGSSVKKSFQHALSIDKKVSKPGQKDQPGAVQGAREVSQAPQDVKESVRMSAVSAASGPEQGQSPTSRVLGILMKPVHAAGKALQALPKFLYPSIRNATAAERELIEKTLDQLPLKSVVSTEFITVNPNLANDMNYAGLARNLFFMHPIDFDKGELAIEGFNKGTIIHEVGHTRDFSESLVPYFGASSKAPWGKAPYVYDSWIDTPTDLYASTNHWEDFAQSYKFYHENPAELQKVNPAKYEAIKKMEEPGLYDKVMDKSGIREAGKKISQVIDKVPGLRLAIETVSAISGPLTIHRGSGKIIKSLEKGDAKELFDGKMDLASGIAYSSKVAAPAGMAIDAVHWYLNRAVKKGKISQEKADDIATRTLSFAAGPVGLSTHAALDEMLGTEDTDIKKIQLVEPKDKAPVPFIKFTWKRPQADVIINGKKVDAKDIALTKDDKIYIAKVGGGAAVGGVAGTVLGYAGGAAAGAVLGGLIAGPIGAGVGAFLGKFIGSFALSSVGAKTGARLGKMLDKSPEKA